MHEHILLQMVTLFDCQINNFQLLYVFAMTCKRCYVHEHDLMQCEQASLEYMFARVTAAPCRSGDAQQWGVQ